MFAIVQSLGPVFGERDPELIGCQANPDGAAWFRQCARRVLADAPQATIAGLSDEEAVATALTIWETINGPNLVENILPTRQRATLVIVKGEDHSVQKVRLRKL